MTRIVLTCAADIAPEPAPWDHYPHCPGCHRRLVSADPARRLAPFNGATCPHCRCQLAAVTP
jgi:hypothetical protein